MIHDLLTFDSHIFLCPYLGIMFFDDIFILDINRLGLLNLVNFLAFSQLFPHNLQQLFTCRHLAPGELIPMCSPSDIADDECDRKESVLSLT